MKHILLVATATIVFVASSVALAEDGAASSVMRPGMMNMGGLKIDVPVVIKEAKVAFRIDRVAPSGDNSFVLQQIAVLKEKLQHMGANGKIVAVFNGEGGFMLLNDMAYNQARKTTSGNPYKPSIANLLAKGVDIEECGMTMMREGWSNMQLLPGVKVNTGANLRVIELAQANYVVLGQ